MTTAIEALTAAESNLQQAKQAALQQKVEEATKDVKTARARAKELRAEHARVMQEIADCDRVVSTGRAELYQIDAEIGARTAPLPDLLMEPEDFSQEIELLKARRAEVLERMKQAQNACVTRTRPAAIVGELEHLEFTVRNLLDIIRHGGSPTNGWQSSLRVVR
jgi:chromosome segregation ATPase